MRGDSFIWITEKALSINHIEVKMYCYKIHKEINYSDCIECPEYGSCEEREAEGGVGMIITSALTLIALIIGVAIVLWN